MRRKTADLDAFERHRIQHDRDAGLMSWAEIAAKHRINESQLDKILS